MSLGHHPFGAVLVAPDHETVLLTQCNIDTVNHAESTLAGSQPAILRQIIWLNAPYIRQLNLAACVLERFIGPISGGWSMP